MRSVSVLLVLLLAEVEVGELMSDTQGDHVDRISQADWTPDGNGRQLLRSAPQSPASTFFSGSWQPSVRLSTLSIILDCSHRNRV